MTRWCNFYMNFYSLCEWPLFGIYLIWSCQQLLLDLENRIFQSHTLQSQNNAPNGKFINILAYKYQEFLSKMSNFILLGIIIFYRMKTGNN